MLLCMAGDRITDPKTLRAMAHPLRWKLIDILNREGIATATRCAEETGESVANCSYHLNTLAKYDYIEQADGGQGRERPWRLVRRNQSWTDVGMDEEGALAAQAATMAFVDYVFAQVKERQLTARLEPDEWRDAVGLTNNTTFLTQAETRELRDAIWELMHKYEKRRTDPSLRPEGARAVSFFLATTVAPEGE
jgi:hypothetical protein